MATLEPQEQPLSTEGPTGTALVPGNTFIAKALQYQVIDGLAMFEGDIVLGTLDEVEQQNEELRDQMSGATASSVVVSGGQFRWPGGQVPFTIDASLSDQTRVIDAIAHWETTTNYRFPARTSEPNYVTFRRGSGCSSSVGRRGGQQFINLGPGCSTGSVIHEIGHTVGLWHEQSREDRDLFVTIHFENIKQGSEHNFNQHIVDGDDVGAYDYGSIMHYSRRAFSIDEDNLDTVVPTDPVAQIGQRLALSAGDIAAANSLIPGAVPTPPVPPPPIPSVTPPYPGRFLKYPPITSGPDVATWQARMSTLGFELDVDGKYGPQSKAACIELQKQRGLTPDGIVGPLTWAAAFAP
jgi:hypothetical protein